eukprot:NODE_8398_length_519_cov_48.991489_g7339_i0.p1 GENE.NODE_8398_length_519_cov_48.991489_g7339_i0~~NODE_8398_length_519_cov_48.991489_g7339_i0.p1  ORF type:complete len:116 (-),score=41.90 NODE_8398_length_519_cov_48.991489_g7339_i0:91-438(-)
MVSYRKRADLTPSSGLRVGLNRGFKVTRRNPIKYRRYAVPKKKLAAVRAVISEVVGLKPYEKHVIDTLRVGGDKAEKRSLRFLKKRLGSHQRAIKKREKLMEVMRQADAKKKART